MAKRKRRKFTPEFKAEVVLEALNVETSQAELCRRHNSHSGNANSLKMRRASLNPVISCPMRLRNELRTSKDALLS